MTQPYQLLQKKNVNLVHHGVGHFSLSRGDESVEVSCGIWAAVWLNHFISSQVDGVCPFPLGLIPDVPDRSAFKKSRFGLLGATSPKLARTFEGLDGLKLDYAMANVFASKKVELGDVGSKINDLKTAYVMDTIEPHPAYKFVEVNEEGAVNVKKNEFCRGPFYLAVVIGEDDDDNPPRLWSSFIENERFHWNMRAGVLYLSNAYSVKMGLPPNHEILGFKMALNRTTRPLERGSQLVQVATGLCVRNVGSFMANPSSATFAPLRTPEMRETRRMFESLGYYTGTVNGKKLNRIVKRRFVAMTTRKAVGFCFTELAQAVEEIAGYDAIVQFCLLMRLEGQVNIIKGDGQDADKFYFGM